MIFQMLPLQIQQISSNKTTLMILKSCDVWQFKRTKLQNIEETVPLLKPFHIKATI